MLFSDQILEYAKKVLERDDLWIKYEYETFWIFHKIDEWDDQCYLVNLRDGKIEFIEQA